MKKKIQKKALLALGGALAVTAVQAVPLPDFMLYGTVDQSVERVEAYQRDQKVAAGELVDGYYKLALPMGDQVSYQTGDSVEIWANGLPTGQRVTIGSFGTAEELNLN